VIDETTGGMLAHVRGGRSGRHTLSDETVQVLVVGALDTEVPAADVVDSLVVNHEAAVRVLEGGVGGEDRVVGLDDRGGDLRGGVDTELELALLAVVDGQALHEEGTETGTCTATEGVEDEEALQTRAVVGDTADLVEDLVDQLLADRVVATSVVVRGILLAGDHVLRVEQRAVGAGADLIDDVGLQVGVDGAGDILALAWGALAVESSVGRRQQQQQRQGQRHVPVSEKKVLKPWSSFLALRSSVR
jgi:hypothetical protein